MKEYRVIKLFSESLNKEKRIYVYLPEDYEKTDEYYPVLYMHDGHNLFDDNIAGYNRSWRIIEQFQEHPEMLKLIVVGIEQESDSRSDELIPFRFQYYDGKQAGGKANQYLDFLTKQVKPYIDKRFRTLKSPKNTALMGSSFGAVNTLYAALEYDLFFSRFACLSNAYLFDGFTDKMDQLIAQKDFSNVKKLYIDVGTKENKEAQYQQLYIEKNKALASLLKERIPKDQFKFEIIEDGIHHESAWEKRFSDVINYLFEKR